VSLCCSRRLLSRGRRCGKRRMAGWKFLRWSACLDWRGRWLRFRLIVFDFGFGEQGFQTLVVGRVFLFDELLCSLTNLRFVINFGQKHELVEPSNTPRVASQFFADRRM